MSTTKKPCAPCAQPDAPNVVRIEAKKGTTYQIGEVFVTPETISTLDAFATYYEDGWFLPMITKIIKNLSTYQEENPEVSSEILINAVDILHRCQNMSLSAHAKKGGVQ